jgi:hypothetical protein
MRHATHAATAPITLSPPMIARVSLIGASLGRC